MNGIKKENSKTIFTNITSKLSNEFLNKSSNKPLNKSSESGSSENGSSESGSPESGSSNKSSESCSSDKSSDKGSSDKGSSESGSSENGSSENGSSANKSSENTISEQEQYGGEIQRKTIYMDPKNANILLTELKNIKKNKEKKTMIYDFKNKIMCELKLDDQVVEGTISGIDHGYHIIAKTKNGNHSINIGDNVKICYGLNELTQEVAPRSSESSTYLSTSEYLFVDKQNGNKSNKKQKTKTNESEMLTSSIGTGSMGTSSMRTSSMRTSSMGTSSMGTSSMGTSSMRTSSMDTSNKSDNYKEIMRGGKQKHKYMKAGRGDKIGIISPKEKIEGYYSDSSSAEDGLCE